MVAQARKVIPMRRESKAEPEPLRLVLPLPPSVNNSLVDVIYYDKKAHKMRVRRVPSPELTAYKQLAVVRLVEQRIAQDSWKGVEAVGITADIYVPTEASDGDNRLKHGQDVLAAWLGFNDKRFRKWTLAKYIDKQNPRIEVHLYPVRKTQKGEL